MKWPILLLMVIALPAISAYPDPIEELWRWAEELLRRAEKAESSITSSLRAEEDENLAAVEFLRNYNEKCQHYNNLLATTTFEYKTNVTKANAVKKTEIALDWGKWKQKMQKLARAFDTTDMDIDMQRMFMLIKRSSAPNDLNVRKELEEYGNKLIEVYSNAKVCRGSECYASTDLVAMYANLSTPHDTLLWAWKGWRQATGPKMKQTYRKLIEASNIGARDHGFRDESIPWMIAEMEDRHLNVTALRLYEHIRPLYEQLHAYVRHNLMKRYPGKVQKDGPIPEHLLGNVWGQQWGQIYPLMEPYPETASPDVTGAMRRQGYTVERMFRTAESFFTSLGLPPMTRKFWERSLFEKPKDGRTVQCHAYAVDMDDKNKDDFRIKMCTDITESDLMTAHHEMGHVEYYMMYKDQPCIFKHGANTAFHEAVGDTMELSVMTPERLVELGLAEKSEMGGDKDVQYKRGINFLLKMALNKVAFLPYGLLLDSWRWSVFNGTTTPDRYNHDWWRIRINLGGVMPPVDRSENDFDPASKYHVASNAGYIKYFFSFITQFQFHRALCQIKGHQGPIHECDIHGSKRAGDALRDMLELGHSRPWPDAMEALTGQRIVDPSAMLQYFKPLYDWLKEENRRNDVTIGWETNNIGVRW